MKKIVAYDFDGTLLDTPNEEEGKEIWKEKTGEQYPHKGWWSRRESLNTDIFNIQPIPTIYSKFKKDIATPDTYVIILTARLEKLRSEIENILDVHGIEPDELILKRGNETKGDIILDYLKKFPNLKKIEVYDDFAGGMESKIDEFTNIKEKLPENVEYNVYYVSENGNYVLMESTNNVLNLIYEELKKLK